MRTPTHRRAGGKPGEDGLIDTFAIELVATCSTFRAHGRLTPRETFEAVRLADRIEAPDLAERLGVDARAVFRVRADLRSLPGRVAELDAYPPHTYREYVLMLLRSSDYSDLNWLAVTDRQLLGRTLAAVEWGIGDIPRQLDEATARFAAPGLGEKRRSALFAIRNRADRLCMYAGVLRTLRRELGLDDGEATACELEAVAA
jgi:hypothetical protein